MLGWLLPLAAAWAGQVHFTSTDGVTLSGETWGSGARGVLLVHDEARTRADWGKLGQKLGNSGYRVLAIDLRGHGASPLADPLGEDWSALVADIDGGVGWLVAQGAKEIHVVGARLGANLALQAAARNEAIGDLVLLSPVLNARGVKVSSAITPYGSRSLFLAAGSTDPLALRTARWLETEAAGSTYLALLEGASHGARMLNEAPELESLIMSWFSGALRATPPAAALPSKEEKLRMGVSEIPTTGVRIDER